LSRDWKEHLENLVRGAERELLITTPFVTRDGVRLVTTNLPSGMRGSGRLVILTDLSPMPICQGSSDPYAIRELADTVPALETYHLPKLHAKVYLSDSRNAIVTSGNLTGGGLFMNYEYGVEISDPPLVTRIRTDILEYARFGAPVGLQQLNNYCEIADRVRTSFRAQLARIASDARGQFDRSLQAAEDELIKLRLAQGPMHRVFSGAILHLLQHRGPLGTQQIHDLIESLYPDLCDNTVDRVIDGKRFGKKWKHAVRTAQQMLKKKGLIDIRDGRWQVTSSEGRGEKP
jgi:hypothetical protein